MPKLDFNEFQKNQETASEEESYTVSEINTTDRQFLIKEEGVVFDVIDLDFDGKGPGMEVIISLLGEDLKLRCDLVPKEVFETYDIPSYLISLAKDFKPCLECKTKFLEELCRHEEEEDDEEA